MKPEDRVYLDEMGSTLNMNLDYGWSRRGEGVYDATPAFSEGRVNTIAVLTEKGMEAMDRFTGALTAERFILYLEVFITTGVVFGNRALIMDNHPVHCADKVWEFLEARGIRYIFLPRYSP